MSAPSSPVLEARRISKSFPGVRALDGVDFALLPGEIHALMGENGAGKSTLIKVLTGVCRADAGAMRLDGRAYAPRSPLHACSLGIRTVYQEVNLVPHLSVAENLRLGDLPVRRGLLDWRRIHREAAEALERLEVRVDVTRPLSSYPLAIQQMVAIARALAVPARALILDEPTSSLDEREASRLFGVLRRLRADGLGIVFVSHFLGQVYAIADRCTVLRNGRLVGAHALADLPRVRLIGQMVGREESEVEAMERRPERAASPAPAEAVLRARGVGKRRRIARFDLDLRPGEILGLAGLLGSGRTEMARLLFGLDRPDTGTVSVRGRRLKPGSPRDAIATGLGYLPEDRKTEGIIPSLSVRENIVLALQARRGWLRRLPAAAQRALAERYIRALGINTPGPRTPAAALSGGNQQKVMLARWLAAEPRVLLLDEPTRGIDVGARAEILRLIDELCADGLAILYISSELEEVAGVAHRVAVLRDRRKIGELAGAEADLETIVRAIARHDND